MRRLPTALRTAFVPRALRAPAGLAAIGVCVACGGSGAHHGINGNPNLAGSTSVDSGGGSGGSVSSDPAYAGSSGNPTLNPGGDPVQPFQSVSVFAAVRKVKNLLTGLPPTDAEIQAVQSAQDARLAIATLIDGWTSAEQ